MSLLSNQWNGGKKLLVGILSLSMSLSPLSVFASEISDTDPVPSEVPAAETAPAAFEAEDTEVPDVQESQDSSAAEIQQEVTDASTAEIQQDVTDTSAAEAVSTPSETEAAPKEEAAPLEEVTKKTFTEAQIAANDYVLYVANCGTTDPTATLTDTVRGLYQSNVEQEYGVDAGTGYTWGYQPDDDNSKRARGGSITTTLTGTYIYMSNSIVFEAGKSGFKYDFELPERASDNYHVIIGIGVPSGWGTKYIDVDLEGKTVVSQKACSQNTTTLIEEDVTVTDGTLNVMVHNPQAGTDRGKDPVLSYILVKAQEDVDIDPLEILKLRMEAYQAQMEGKSYSEETQAAFDEVVETIEKLIADNSQDKAAIEAAQKALDEAFANLLELHKETYSSIPGTAATRMYDNNGYKIQAHGGQIQQLTVNGVTKWYWIGEDKTNGYQPCAGIHMYTSTDLYNWTDEGLVLKTMTSEEQFDTDPYFKALYGDLDAEQRKLIYTDLAQGTAGDYKTVIERPKMLYNESTGKYVIWFHADGKSPYEEGGDSNYAKAKAGVAIADSPTGPFKLLGSYMLAHEWDNHGFDSVGGHVRDMNVFKDDDGTAYVMYSSEGNAVMYIAKLNSSYTGLAKDAEAMVLGEDFAITSTDSREAPAMFKYEGKYYLITSGCTGWSPNPARYAVADDPLGPWTNMGNPCVGDTNNNTFWTQSTCVIPVDPANGKYIYMGDRWYNPDNGADLSDSRYVWLPIEFGSEGKITIKDYSNWTLDELEGKGSITIDTELPKIAKSIDDLLASMPKTVDVTINGKATKGTPVEWKVSDSKKAELGNYAMGDISVTGTLTEINDREISTDVFCCPPALVYFADCNTNNENISEIYDKFAENANELLNTVSDQAYGDDQGINWGYTSTTGASEGTSAEDMGSHGTGDFFDTGWWASNNGKITYSFELEPGNYMIATGYQEWWTSTRATTITVTSVDAEGTETEIGSTSFTLNREQDLQKLMNDVVTVPEDSDHVIVAINKTTSNASAPVLSWIGVISTDEAKQELGEELATNGSFETSNDGWSLGNGASIIESDDAPEGTHYLRDNGAANSWGDGSSYSMINVSPDTEYLLKGIGKVGTGTTYWVGVRFYKDGKQQKEVYCVFSASSTYTDTTNTDSKLAAYVAAGATDWTPFEFKFTVPSDVTTVDLYTWADPGSNDAYGYIDALSLKEVGSVSLDWSDFDALMEEIDALDQAEYTEDSWAAFQEVVDAAKAFKENANEETKQRDIRLKVAELEAAMEELISIHEPTGDQIYYVDAAEGNDDNDGLSPEHAWKTLAKASSIRKMTEGGSILLKAGCVWNGEQLSVNNAVGTKENPIVIGSYGEGPKPVINGQGASWRAGRKEQMAAVHICNSENIVIENLEITNWDDSVSGDYGESSKLLSGLVVENRDAGKLSNVVIRNNKIHDVNGRMAGGSEKAAGGLIVVVTGTGTGHTGTVESYFDGLTIEGNEVYKVCHEAIYMESVWASRTLVGGSSQDTSYQNAGNSKWVGSSNVVIESNYVHDVAGDGIVPINTLDALVQYNLVDNSADSNWAYGNNPNHAALWAWDANNVTFQYNESSNTSKNHIGSAVGNDSMSFDFDYGLQNTLYQYNYSHDNLGGFMMLCPGPGATVNNIARYNLSVNDGLYEGAPMIRMGTGKYGSIGVQVYNNTMYWEDTGYKAALTPDSYWEGPVIREVSVFNNIFYGPATDGSVSTQSGITYYNNLVYSSDGSAEKVYEAAANDVHAIYEDPMFVDPTDYTSGSWSDGVMVMGSSEGFKLQEGSPAIDAGANHPAAPNSTLAAASSELVENKTEAPTTDYYGASLSDGMIDIGVSEYTEEVVVDKTELASLVNTVTQLTKEDYTEASYQAAAAALEAALAVLEDEEATQEMVDEALAALQEAVAALVYQIEVDLQKLYDENADLQQGNYTDESYEAFLAALKAAEEVLADETATKEDLQAAYDALADAIDALTVEEEPPVDDSMRKALQALYDANKNREQGSYSDESYEAFQAALKAAEDVLAKEDASEEELKAAYDALTKAINELTVDRKPTVTPSVTPSTSPTVTPSKSPVSPSPTTKPSGNRTTTGKTSVRTADTNPVALFAAVALAAFAVLAAASVIMIRRRRRS